jgi:hypothetical protein
MRRLLLVAVIVTFTACTRPGDYPISSNCTWLEDGNRVLDLTKMADRRHLHFDAVIAEDLAIRWADKNFGHRPEWDQRCAACMETLFQGVAQQHHGVDVSVVRQYSRERDVLADAAVILSFGVVYVFAAYLLAGRIGRRFPAGEPGFWVMTLAMAVGISLVGVLAGGLWSIVIEGFRLNSAHLSFRMNRLPLRQHWPVLFVYGFVVFASVSLFRVHCKRLTNLF